MNDRQQEYERLIAPIEVRMMRTVWRISRDPNDAEDAFQEALLTVWKRWDRIVTHSNPHALILHICAAMTAVVMPMRGPFAQTQSALQTVESYLKAHGVTPVGRPFGHYGSEQHWDAGYPVPPGTRVEAPFELVSLPAGLAASVVVNGPWGNDFYGRWAAFLKSVVEQGYVPAGQPMAIWSGEQAMEKSQSTEMRIPVTKAK